jgi:two-component system catabolic regulation response regulator CreB
VFTSFELVHTSDKIRSRPHEVPFLDENFPMPSALVFEENLNQRLGLKSQLDQMGFFVIDGSSEEEVLELVSRNKCDIIIVSSGQNPASSRQLVVSIRAQSNVPILCILEPGAESMVSAWLDAGADDYLVRPLIPRLFTARVIQQQRRIGHVAPQNNKVLIFESLRLEPQKHEFSVNGEPVALTSAEFQIMHLLMEHPEQVFSREQILESLGLNGGEGTNQIVDTHASRIRRKVRQAGGPEILRAVRSVGFRLSPPLTKSAGS